jgi:glycosyltransferase involved in cell wall biosynthesis
MLRISKRLYYNYYIKSFLESKENHQILNVKRNEEKNRIKNEYPLVSVLIATYNRSKLLTERTIPSVLKQTYQKFEIVIVGDHCTDNTEKLIEELGDRRIKFYNLSKRGEYPLNPVERWKVAGVVPRNKALEICSGDWIAPLDDDDEFSEDHIEVLLNYGIEHNYEMVYGKVKMEINPGKWVDLGSYPPKTGRISHLSVLYNSNLKFLIYDINCWKYDEPADWNMWRRMVKAGVRIGFLNKIVGKHYLERTHYGD